MAVMSGRLVVISMVKAECSANRFVASKAISGVTITMSLPTPLEASAR
jgi:hypothetical protein